MIVFIICLIFLSFLFFGLGSQSAWAKKEKKDKEDNIYFDTPEDDKEEPDDSWKKIKLPKGWEVEEETSEGNAFTNKLRQTPKGGKFKLGNKEYTDNSSLEESKKNKFIQKATSKMEKRKTLKLFFQI